MTIDRIIRREECLKITGLKPSTIALMEKEGRFPRRHLITGNISGWRESEIQEWIDKLTGKESSQSVNSEESIRDRKGTSQCL